MRGWAGVTPRHVTRIKQAWQPCRLYNEVKWQHCAALSRAAGRRRAERLAGPSRAATLGSLGKQGTVLVLPISLVVSPTRAACRLLVPPSLGSLS